MATKFRQLNEALDWVFEAPKKEQVSRLKEVATSDQTLVPIVRMGVGAEKPEWGLPEGMPEVAKIQDDIPDGMGETTLKLEWRRITFSFTSSLSICLSTLFDICSFKFIFFVSQF